MQSKIIFEMIIKKEDVTLNMLEEWLQLACNYFEPLYMRRRNKTKGKEYRYKKTFWDDLQSELEEEKIWICLRDESKYVELVQSGYSKENLILTYEVLDKEGEEFEKIFETFLLQSGIVGYCCAERDFVRQNTRDVDYYEFMGFDLDDVTITRTRFGEEIDIENNPGHIHYDDGVWFGSCYRMWFGKDYYQYISKEKLQSFSNCYENCELENGVTRITLYEDMWDYANPVNRKKQWNFRKTVGMDEVAHELKEHPRRKVDPEVEIFEGKYEHGGVRLIHQYYDESGNRIAKSKASKIRILEFSWDGKLLYEEEKLL